MNYLAILGRQPEISLSELEALFSDVKKLGASLASFKSSTPPGIDHLGGTLKLAEKLDQKPLEYLSALPEGKITLGLSDYSNHTSPKAIREEALKLKKILVRHGRSVRVVESKTTALSTATSLHNGLSGKNPRKIELIKTNSDWYHVIGVQDIDSYAHRDQARPARDAKVGMLPPKLAQILINLCGPLKPGATVLDPFCGTGVVLQEAILMGYQVYGTDLSDRMVEYSKKNLNWLMKSVNVHSQNDSKTDKASLESEKCSIRGGPEAGKPRSSARAPWRRAQATRPENEHLQILVGDATSFKWNQPIDAVACESYLGRPMTTIPSDIELKTEKQECSSIILGFLKNLHEQITSGTPVVIAVPAWLRENGEYSRLGVIDLIANMGYNVNNKTHKGLLYYREKQIVARDILILRKK